MQRFTAVVEPAPQGGHFVVVPDAVAAAAGLAHGSRTRGTVNDVPFRAALMKYGGTFYLGVHKATLEKADAAAGARIRVVIEIDDQPLLTDVVPDDLAEALAKRKSLAAAWERLAPSHKREHVKAILDAKKPETRARRIAKAMEMLAAAPPPSGKPRKG